MAKSNKRKEQYKQAREAGLSSKQASQIRSHSPKRFKQELKQAKSEIRKQATKDRHKEQYRQAREAGLNSKQANRMRNFSKERFAKEFQNPGGFGTNENYIIVGYREFTHGQDAQGYFEMKELNTTTSRKELEQQILDGLEHGSYGGFLGDYRIDIVTGIDLEMTKRMYQAQEYLPTYTGQGKQLQPILSFLNVMGALLYPDVLAKLLFEFVDTLDEVGYPESAKNAKFLRDHFFDFISGNPLEGIKED
jgi:hypothetical protein